MEDKMLDIEVLAEQTKQILSLAQESEITDNPQLLAVLFIGTDYCNRILQILREENK